MDFALPDTEFIQVRFLFGGKLAHWYFAAPAGDDLETVLVSAAAARRKVRTRVAIACVTLTAALAVCGVSSARTGHGASLLDGVVGVRVAASDICRLSPARSGQVLAQFSPEGRQTFDPRCHNLLRRQS